MNKTLAEIIQNLFDAKESNTELAPLTSTSKTAIWRQIMEAVAFVIFNFQEAVRMHMEEIDTKIREQKVPTLRWYRNLALRFQYGFDLIPETDEFRPDYYDAISDNWIVADEDQINSSKIIKYAAVTRNVTNGKVRISMKIAGDNIDAAISDEKVVSFKKYIEETQATGDNIVIVNYTPDILKINFKIAYNPSVLLENGQSILLGNVFPVVEAIRKFMKNLPFNGELSVQKLEAAILAVEGVNDLQNLQVQSKWIEPGVGYGFYQPVEISRIPKSGRFKVLFEVEPGFDQNDVSTITYVNYQPET
ncbi:nucleotidyltransferase [Chryseobacterium sp. R2A-55]|uniref:nucleotidyltransferase n=1 Tax=Chryseobacterium sp. R2A-55 TaxID=2744445 RepID=UPI001F2B8A2F|nr:nucleotidyltransferase [Chryseobacterium sp. R2A-55]